MNNLYYHTHDSKTKIKIASNTGIYWDNHTVTTALRPTQNLQEPISRSEWG